MKYAAFIRGIGRGDPALQAVCGITDTTVGKTPDFMIWLERQYGKDITTRTLGTIQRVNARM